MVYLTAVTSQLDGRKLSVPFRRRPFYLQINKCAPLSGIFLFFQATTCQNWLEGNETKEMTATRRIEDYEELKKDLKERVG